MANFKKIIIKGLEKDEEVDLRKTIGNSLYYNSKDLSGSELGRKIYFSEDDIELTADEKQQVMETAQQIWGTYVMCKAIEDALK